ncbi:MAG: TlpA family protein disulfide reductase [Chromatiales bacterium]|nr:TlpA family protein disulfide reductase [Chromatiales bacterium]
MGKPQLQQRCTGLLGGIALLLCGCLTPAYAEWGNFSRQWWEPAPPFHLEDLNGRLHHLTEYRGKVLVVNFWASWCAPCREELPSMNRAWEALQGENVAMLAINLGEDREAVDAFIKDFPIDFTVLLDRRGNISQRWRVTGMPTTFLVDPQGNIAYRIVGKREWDSDELLQLVRELVLVSGRNIAQRA